jgi:hypothetical protein
MRYTDTGSRDPSDALGAWLAGVSTDESVTELRWQTGFFSAEGIGHLAPMMRRLAETDGNVRLLIGSNEGVTRRADIEALLVMAGSPRENLRIGIVSFVNAFFHPKVVHVTRADGSMAAYVGSANLTASGVASLHVEAGVTLDTTEGDNVAALQDIASRVDWWFSESRDGLFLVGAPSNLDHLAQAGVLGVPRPPSARQPANRADKASGVLAALRSLIPIPKLPRKITDEVSGAISPTADEAIPPPDLLTIEAEWSKKISASDAQRKGSGNQRGSITLVKNRYPIDARVYFRRDFFGTVEWFSDRTRTGEVIESAYVPMLVNLDGLQLGVLNLQISHAPNREAGQNNYTTLLHLGPLAPYFAQENMTDRNMRLERRNDGSFALTIQ